MDRLAWCSAATWLSISHPHEKGEAGNFIMTQETPFLDFERAPVISTKLESIQTRFSGASCVTKTDKGTRDQQGHAR